MRKNIFEAIKSLPNDIYTDYVRLEVLFSENKSIGVFGRFGYRAGGQATVEEYIDQFLFTQWKFRGRYLTVADLRNFLEIDKEHLSKKIDLDKLLMFIEFLINMVDLIVTRFDRSQFYFVNENYISTITTNIVELLDRLNYKISQQKEGYYIVVEKSNDSTAVAEVYDDISEKVIEYKRFAFKGDLDKKAQALLAIGKKYEAVISTLKANNFGEVVNNTSFLLNNIDIRHNNFEGTTAKEAVIKMKPDELEEWYDKTYDALLLSLMLAHYIDYKDEIRELKQKISQK